jgi:hypothetical protein
MSASCSPNVREVYPHFASRQAFFVLRCEERSPFS